ncbi:oligopeptidase A [Candidatus Erwinia haradaeae]|uniref:oligopeptidase A n=1 Tax=Candidatus Erwinia haradaeae TaxID=1922217 RepID=A0A451D9T3_9GAMM|nr:oligopeptidase A [Candidatus Erwinia haradaeae]VFP83050.1 Oligopeptidase A [Candidatus Erwinia haradaeae]
MVNPLLASFTLPPFHAIRSEHIVPAITQILNECKATVNQVVSQSGLYNWHNLVQPLIEADDKLSRVFSPVSHLNLVTNNPLLRAEYEKILPMMSEYSTWIGQHKGLYQAYCQLKEECKSYASLTIEQKKVVENTLRDFKLSGVGLPQDKQYRYKEIAIRLSILSSVYSNNVLDSTMSWSQLITDPNQISGIPERIIVDMKEKAVSKGKDGWLLTLDLPNYLAVMTYCSNQSIRKDVYYAYNTRASDQGPNAGQWDNTEIMSETLALRHELSHILGFESYAAQSLSTKMAKNISQVMHFLDNLEQRIQLQAEKEITQLHVFAKEKYNIDILEQWDTAFFSEKQRKSLYHISDEQIRPYFPEHRVLNGLFTIVNRVYGIRAEERYDVDVYHEDVRFFDLFDETNTLRGSFFLDLYIRDNKCSGAWMDDCVSQMRMSDGRLQKPVAYITCNFHRPSSGKKGLFTHNEVLTLFHEFGHGIHHTLTEIETRGVSGIHGVPWDAVELPSQLMESWCWEPEALVLLSGHYETNEPLPTDMISKMLSAKNYQSALYIQRQLILAIFDMRLHSEVHCHGDSQVLAIFREVKNRIDRISESKWSRFPHTFNHIFSGGYAAGYYSYLWAEVLAADAWSRFKTEGILNRKTGQSFLENILTRGGAENPMTLLFRFLGREPKIDAMLAQHGIPSISNQK